jgi:hypothetical protein
MGSEDHHELSLIKASTVILQIHKKTKKKNTPTILLHEELDSIPLPDLIIHSILTTHFKTLIAICHNSDSTSDTALQYKDKGRQESQYF